MRIDLTQLAANHVSSEPNPTQMKAQEGATSILGGSEDRTTLTSTPDSVKSLVSTAMASPEIRQDKVDTLKQAINSGQYEFDPAKIAKSMIDELA